MKDAIRKEIVRVLTATTKAVIRARATTESLQQAISASDTLPGNALELIKNCQATHRAAHWLADSFLELFDDIDNSLLSVTGAALQKAVRDAAEKAGQLAVPEPSRTVGFKTVVDDLLALDKAAQAVAEDECGNLKALTDLGITLANSCTCNTRLKSGLLNGCFKRIGAKFWHYVSGVIIVACCIFFLCWIRDNALDNPALRDLSRLDSARGLLTLLVVGATILIGIIIVAAMWLGDGDDESKEKFLRSKEVFAVFMTASGTILGFYYGSDKGTGVLPAKLTVTSPAIMRAANAASNATLGASISGGVPPYSFSVGSDIKELLITNSPVSGETVLYTWTNAPMTQAQFTLIIKDANTNVVRTEGHISDPSIR